MKKVRKLLKRFWNCLTVDGTAPEKEHTQNTCSHFHSHEQMLLKSREEAGNHWKYVSGVLMTHRIPLSDIDMCGSHYRAAFEHGWKHSMEYMLEHKL